MGITLVTLFNFKRFGYHMFNHALSGHIYIFPHPPSLISKDTAVLIFVLPAIGFEYERPSEICELSNWILYFVELCQNDGEGLLYIVYVCYRLKDKDCCSRDLNTLCASNVLDIFETWSTIKKKLLVRTILGPLWWLYPFSHWMENFVYISLE